MNDFTKLTPFDAVAWYAENSDHHLDVDTLRTLLGHGITGTDEIVEIARTTALDDLEKVPGLKPTLANLRLLAQVGPDVMAQDPENVSDWLGLVDHPQVKDEGFEALGPFIASGRGPAFARQVLDLFERHPDQVHDADGDYDLTRPYAELVDMVENNLKLVELNRWKADGFDLADAILLRAHGLDLERIAFLRERGVPRENWATYAAIPSDWFKERYGASAVELPDGVDVDLLLTMTVKGWGMKYFELGGRRGRGGRHWVYPWQVLGRLGAENLDREQIETLIEGGLTNLVASSYFVESRAGASADRHKTPPPLIVYSREASHELEGPTTDSLIQWWIKLANAGVRPSHLSEYRWVGCTTYQQILDAKAAGITPKRAKELRELHGVKTGYQVSDAKRIASLATLLAYHQADEENNSAATRPDERKVS